MKKKACYSSLPSVCSLHSLLPPPQLRLTTGSAYFQIEKRVQLNKRFVTF
ncbi:hypothetical protein ABGV42_07810 [Paenibacillus pabuli]